MAIIDANPHVAKARAAIMEILAGLERDTGQIVDDLVLEAIDVTQMGDSAPRHQMDVRITLARIPGHQW